MTPTRACPACGARAAEHVHRLAMRTPTGHPLGDGYDVVTCVRCGTGYADVDVPQSFYDRYYAEQAKYAAEAATDSAESTSAEPPWKAARLEEAAGRIVDLVGTDARVLDIGCANGALLGALKRRGVTDVLGVDPSPDSAVMAARHHGVRVEVGTFSNLPAGIGTFDCVCLTGVVEHVLDMDEAMTAVAALVRPGGIVYLDLPDASSYVDVFISPFEDFSSEHVNHFSPTTVQTLAGRFGFETIVSERFVTDLVAGVPCGCIRAIWRKPADASVASAVTEPDVALPWVLHRFTERSRAELATVDARLDLALGDHDEYAIWGVGELTLKLLALPSLARRRLVALVDGNPARRGMRFDDVSVASPAELPAGVPVVVGSLLSAGSITRAIAATGMANPIVSLSPVDSLT